MSKRRQKLPTETIIAEIEKFSHDGRGIARINGKTTFIQGALPNEKVSFQYTRKKVILMRGGLLQFSRPLLNVSNLPAPITPFAVVAPYSI